MHSDDIYTPKKEFKEKLDRIKDLFKYHAQLGGDKPGKREAGLQILNESAIVLLYAAWENYVEYECVFWATHVVVYTKSPTDLQNSLKAMVARAKTSKCELDNWIYAGENWKRETLIAVAKEISKNHQASPERVDDLIFNVIGLRNISKNWAWPAMSADRARKLLIKYISIRGALAHTAGAKATVTLDQCKQFATHLESLVKRTSQLLEQFAEKDLAIECNKANDAIVEDIIRAVYEDIETWQKGEASEEINEQLREKGLI